MADSGFSLDEPFYGSDVAYTGLDDTASSFTGSSTDQMVIAGSGLPIGPSPYADPASVSTGVLLPNSQVSTSDMWEMDPLLQAPYSLELSGVADPPFASATASTPYPNAGPSSLLSTLTGSVAKFGSSLGQLLGGAPATARPGVQQAGPGVAAPVSGTSTLLLVVVVAALILLLARSES